MRCSSVDTESVTDQPAIAAPAYLSTDYVELQIRFAEQIAEHAGLPLQDALLRYTNFHRRMGLGVPGQAPLSRLWLDMMGDISTLSHEARVARIFPVLMAHGDGSAVLLPGRVQFGCFACEPPDAEGMVRIHFGNRVVNADVGPLHLSRVAERRAELVAMFGWLVHEHPETRRVDGGSWLYNLEAYRRLFPKDFADSRSARNGPAYLHGMSTWGQFIDFRAHIRPAVRDQFLASLPDLDMAAPHRIFPYQVLFTTAPFDAFRREYGV
jgi:hypothetical protein